MGCFSCSKLSKNAKNVVKYYRELYETKGLETYVYRLCGNCDFKIVRKEYFNDIFNKEIKPNFEKGAEYFSIQEFKGG